MDNILLHGVWQGCDESVITITDGFFCKASYRVSSVKGDGNYTVIGKVHNLINK